MSHRLTTNRCLRRSPSCRFPSRSLSVDLHATCCRHFVGWALSALLSPPLNQPLLGNKQTNKNKLWQSLACLSVRKKNWFSFHCLWFLRRVCFCAEYVCVVRRSSWLILGDDLRCFRRSDSDDVLLKGEDVFTTAGLEPPTDASEERGGKFRFHLLGEGGTVLLPHPHLSLCPFFL